MANEEAKPNAETPSEPTREQRTQKVRQTQIIVLASCIGADVVLFGIGCWLMYKFGVDLSPAKLFTTAMIFVNFCGVLPAVVLSVIWPKGGEHEQAAIRRTQYGYNVIMACRLLFGALVILNVIVGKYGPRHYDWTSDRVFTLDSVSVKTIKSLEKPVKFIAMYPRLSEPGRQLETLFTMYGDVSKTVSHEFVDRFADKARTDEIYKEFPDSKQNEPVVVLTFGTGENPEHKTIRHSEIFPPSTVDPRMMSEVKTEFKGEDAFTSAITQLTQSKKTDVFFTTGHGELAITNSDRRSDEGIGIIKERMETQGMQVEAVNLAQKEVPKNASILVIAGPKTPFFPEEVQKVKDFIAGGGHLVAMLDPGPEMREEATTGLESLLAEYSVEVKDNLAIDLGASMNSPVMLLEPVGDTRSSNAIVEDLKDYNVLLDRVREIAALTPPSPPGQPPGAMTGPYQADTLIATLGGNTLRGTPVSWGESDYKKSRQVSFNEKEDSKGPVSLAVAVSKNIGPGADPHMGMPGAPPPRQKAIPLMVVFGDSSFASNVWASRAEVANRDLFLNSVNWLRGRLELVGIQPKSKTAPKLTLDSGKYFKMWFGPGAVMFVCLTGLGVLVWIVRHRF